MKQSKLYVVGLTGGIASGKSTLSKALRNAGAPVIDADDISHRLTAQGGPALPLIRKAFGDAAFSGEALDRRALGSLVFADGEKRQQLNAILHPLILLEMHRQMAALDAPACVLDVPLLFESGWDSLCNEVWCAWVPRWVQLRRLMRRDGLSPVQAMQRVKSQMSTREKLRRADYAINTTGTKQESAGRALSLWQQALERARHA